MKYFLGSFHIVKRKDIISHSEYWTKSIILECYDSTSKFRRPIEQGSIHRGKRNLINVIFQMKRGKGMKKKDEILQILNTHRSYLKKVYGVRNIGLFGSYSRGEEGPDSDLDLLVEFDRPIGFFKFVELEDYLTEKLGIKVEVVTKDALKPLLRPYIMKDIIYV